MSHIQHQGQQKIRTAVIAVMAIAIGLSASACKGSDTAQSGSNESNGGGTSVVAGHSGPSNLDAQGYLDLLNSRVNGASTQAEALKEFYAVSCEAARNLNDGQETWTGLLTFAVENGDKPLEPRNFYKFEPLAHDVNFMNWVESGRFDHSAAHDAEQAYMNGASLCNLP